MATINTIPTQEQPPKLRRIYNYLRSQNKVRSETYDDFATKMQDPMKLEKVYNYLRDQNKVSAETFDVFQEKIGVKKKDESLLQDDPLSQSIRQYAQQKNQEVLESQSGLPESPETTGIALESGLTEDEGRTQTQNFDPDLAKLATIDLSTIGKPFDPESIRAEYYRKLSEEAGARKVIADIEKTYNPREQSTGSDIADAIGEGMSQMADIANDPLNVGAHMTGQFNKAIITTMSSLPKSVAIIANKLNKFTGLEEDKPVEEMSTYKAGQWLEDTAVELGITATDPNREGKFWQSTIPQAFGSIAGIILTGGRSLMQRGSAQGLEMAITTPKGALGQSVRETGNLLTSPGAISGGTAMAVPEFEAAKTAGMSDEEAFGVWAKNYFVGQTEILPLQNALSRINKLSGGKLIDLVKSGVPGAFEEGVQETIQTVLTNKIAQGSYDPKRDLFTDVLESGGAGAFVGMFLPGIGMAMQKMTPEQRRKTQEVLNEEFKAMKAEADAMKLAPDPIVTAPEGDLGKPIELQNDEAVSSSSDNDTQQQDASDQAEPVSTVGPGSDLSGLKRSEQAVSVQGIESTATEPESETHQIKDEVDQKSGSIIPRVTLKGIPSTDPAFDNIKNTLINAGKITVNDKEEINVKQNSGYPSQLFNDLIHIADNKSEALNQYLRIKQDDGDFKKKFGDWENKIMKEYGRAGNEYTVKRGVPKDADLNQFAWVEQDAKGNLVIRFNDNKTRRDSDFLKVKQEYSSQVVEKETGTQEQIREYKTLYDSVVNKLRDLKLHLIHQALLNKQKGSLSIEDNIQSLKEIERLNNIELAKDYYGEPLIFMHSGPEGITRFLKPGDKGYVKRDKFTGNAGLYFSRSPKFAQKYAEFKDNKPGQGKDIYYTFLRAKNPYYITDPRAQDEYPLKSSKTITDKDVAALTNLGYDAIIWDHERAGAKHEIVVFEPDQVEIIGSYREGLKANNTKQKPTSAQTNEAPVSSPAEQRADISAEAQRDISLHETEVSDSGGIDQATDSRTEVATDYAMRLREIEDINSSIQKLRTDNPKQFNKNGEPKANSKIKESYRALVDKRDQSLQGIQTSMEEEFAKRAENESEISRQETQKINEEFEARQKELWKYIPEEELQEEAIFDRINSTLDQANERELSDEEVSFLNENAFKPEEFVFNTTGGLVKQSTLEGNESDIPGGAIDSQKPKQIADDSTTDTPIEQPDQTDSSPLPTVDEDLSRNEASDDSVPEGAIPIGTEVEFEWLGRRMTGKVWKHQSGRVHIRGEDNISYPVSPMEVNRIGVTAKKAAPKDAEKSVKFNSKRKKPIGIVGDPSSGFMFMTDLGEKLAGFFKKQFTSKGFLPKYVFDRWIGAKGDISLYENQIRFTVSDFKKAIKTDYNGKLTDEQITDLNLYLQGKQTTNPVPPETAKILDVMRAQIDNLSTRFINEGIISGDLQATFTKNLGVYLTRSYRKFDDPFWAEFVPVEVRNKAEAFIRNNAATKGEVITDEEVEGLINYILYDPKAPMAVLAGSKLGSKDLSILKKRGDIAPEIRALMGEYSDPLLNYARSVTKMATLIAKHHFLTDVKLNGTGKFLFDKPTGKYSVKLAADGSKTMSPLNGMYTSREIADAFNEFNSHEALPAWLKVYMKAISIVKANKTVFSVQTHARNIVGNIGFVVMNGHWRVNNAGKATQSAWAHLYDSDQKIRDKFLEYVQLGIVQDSAIGGELRQYIKDVRDGKDFFETLGERSLAKASRKILDVTQKAYQAEDDMFKIYAFENEYARYRKAYPNKTETEVKRIAADIVTNTYPTYSRVPKIIKGLRANPLVGTFVAFPAEVFRTTYNTMELAAKEMARPETRDIGVQRTAGILSALLLPTAASMYTLYSLGMDGADDDDIRKFAAPWQKDSEFLYLKTDKDKYTIIDLGYSDPHNYLKRPIYQLLSDGPLLENGIDAAQALARPFLDENILTERLIDIHRNKKATGDHVYNKDASVGDQLSAIYSHLWPVTEPGTIASLRRIRKGMLGETDKYGKVYDTTGELMSVITGQKEEIKDITQALLYRAYELKDRIEATEKDYFRTIKNMEATEEQKDNAERIKKEATDKIVADAKDIYLSAIRLGVDPKIARRYMILTRNEQIFRATAGAK